MQKISRAGDNLWVVSAFDPRKPVDPDWASRPPAPVLRSGDEENIFGDSPHEHHQGEDSMQSSPEGTGAEQPDLDDLFGWDVPEPEYYHSLRHDVPAEDLADIYRYRRLLRGPESDGGNLEGSDPAGPMVQNYPRSNVNHYYTYNPAGDVDNPWHLSTTHWELRDPIISRHPSFVDAVARAHDNKVHLEGRGIH